TAPCTAFLVAAPAADAAPLVAGAGWIEALADAARTVGALQLQPAVPDLVLPAHPHAPLRGGREQEDVAVAVTGDAQLGELPHSGIAQVINLPPVVPAVMAARLTQ